MGKRQNSKRKRDQKIGKCLKNKYSRDGARSQAYEMRSRGVSCNTYRCRTGCKLDDGSAAHHIRIS